MSNPNTNPSDSRPVHTLTRAEAWQLARAALALERIACHLEAFGDAERPLTLAELLEAMNEAASELAHHADAIREASGLNGRTAANLDTLTRNPSTR